MRQPIGPGGQPAANKLVPTRTFTLSNTRLPDPDTLVSTSVQSFGGQVTVSRSEQRRFGFASIQLSQRNLNGGGGVPNMVMFSVNDFSGAGGDQVSFNVQEPDVATLFREHPVEIERYLRPLLTELGQEQLFAPEPLLAWQVLNQYWRHDPAIARQVAALLPELDNPDYRAREKALAGLIALGRPGAAVLLRRDKADFTAATEQMVSRALAAYKQLPEREATRLRNDVSFLLDCQYVEDPELRRAALTHLQAVTKRDKLAINPDGSDADRSAAVRALRADLLGQGAATQPATQPATKPATKPTTKPTTQPAPEAATRPSPKAATRPAHQSVQPK